MKRSIEEILLNPKPGSKAAAAKEFGIDLTLLIRNLRLSPEERLTEMQNSVEAFEQFANEIKSNRHISKEANKIKVVLKSLSDENVEYVIVGELVAFVHGWKTIADKLEFCYSGTDENLNRIVKSLLPFNPRLRDFSNDSSTIFQKSLLKNEPNIKLETQIGNIDLLKEVAGIGSFQEVLDHSDTFHLYGFGVHILSIDGLIKAKLAAGRPKDLLILPELEAIKEGLSEDE